ncbi:hypothetical protein MSAN_02440600 [Mycena sanguinolenta]|uniref:Uncharacterized protein n=1 Tax=Mycena sanguinolenta TaxID=230812 RepID=A0A8H6WYU9_9AGAR|nr:hypothetical protein MSAN_02440600 [Mycena sanguinolenta]
MCDPLALLPALVPALASCGLAAMGRFQFLRRSFRRVRETSTPISPPAGELSQANSEEPRKEPEPSMPETKTEPKANAETFRTPYNGLKFAFQQLSSVSSTIPMGGILSGVIASLLRIMERIEQKSENKAGLIEMATRIEYLTPIVNQVAGNEDGQRIVEKLQKELESIKTDLEAAGKLNPVNQFINSADIASILDKHNTALNQLIADLTGKTVQDIAEHLRKLSDLKMQEMSLPVLKAVSLSHSYQAKPLRCIPCTASFPPHPIGCSIVRVEMTFRTRWPLPSESPVLALHPVLRGATYRLVTHTLRPPRLPRSSLTLSLPVPFASPPPRRAFIALRRRIVFMEFRITIGYLTYPKLPNRRIASHCIEGVHRAYIRRGQHAQWMSTGRRDRYNRYARTFRSVPCPTARPVRLARALRVDCTHRAHRANAFRPPSRDTRLVLAYVRHDDPTVHVRTPFARVVHHVQRRSRTNHRPHPPRGLKRHRARRSCASAFGRAVNTYGTNCSRARVNSVAGERSASFRRLVVSSRSRESVNCTSSGIIVQFTST